MSLKCFFTPANRKILIFQKLKLSNISNHFEAFIVLVICNFKGKIRSGPKNSVELRDVSVPDGTNILLIWYRQQPNN